MSALLYIHGFLSSPQSKKAQLVQAWLQQHRPQWQYLCPELSAYPTEVAQTLESIVAAHRESPLYLIGSSLGGFYATYLMQKFDLKAVLVNPAVKPRELMLEYLGRDLRNYYSEKSYRLASAHVDQLRSLEVDSINNKHKLWLLAQTGDETLDYRRAVQTYQGCLQNIEEGGDHSFQQFENWLPKIIDFFER